MYPSSVLAYMGDSVMSLQVREYLIKKGITQPSKLLKHSIEFVSAANQAVFMKHLLDEKCLNEEEFLVFRRGFNHKFRSKAKNANITEYKYSTALEALWGYWYLKGDETKLTQMWDKYKTFSEEKHATIHLLQE